MPVAPPYESLIARTQQALELGWIEEAGRQCAAALAAAPGAPQAHALAAQIAMARGDWSGAAAHCRGAIDRGLRDPNLAALLAMAMHRSGDSAAAEATLRTAAAPALDRPEIACELVAVLIAQAKHVEAAALAEQTTLRHPSFRSAYAWHARALYDGGDAAAAVEALKPAVERWPDDVELLRALAAYQHKSGELAASIESTRRAVDLAPSAEARAALMNRLAEAGRFDEALAANWKDMESRGGTRAASVATDRLMAAGLAADAIAAFSEVRPRLPRPSAEYTHRLRAGRNASEPVSAVAIEQQHGFNRIDVAELTAGCGVPVRLFRLDAIADLPRPGSPGRTLFILPWATTAWLTVEGLVRLVRERPDDLVVAWLYDNHHEFAENELVARACHAVFPAHGFCDGYLRTPTPDDGRIVGPPTPMCVTQWPRGELVEHWSRTNGVPRADGLLGGFSYYALAHRRNILVHALRREPWATGIALHIGARPYHDLSPYDRFLDWRRYKTSLHVSVADDLPIRVFDALAAGHVPIVPRATLDLDAVITPADQAMLPVIRFEDYTVDAVQAAHAEAVAAFDRGGEAQASVRHAYVRDRHMLVHRIAAIVRYVNSRYAGGSKP